MVFENGGCQLTNVLIVSVHKHQSDKDKDGLERREPVWERAAVRRVQSGPELLLRGHRDRVPDIQLRPTPLSGETGLARHRRHNRR